MQGPGLRLSALATKTEPLTFISSYSVAIRDNWTKEVREIGIDHPWGPGSKEWWTEGAMACDCGRTLVFEAEDDVGSIEGGGCEKRGRFTVLWADLGNLGRVVIEEPWVLH